MKTSVKQLFKSSKEYEGKEVIIQGWVRTNRDQKEFGFINLNDGSFFENLQVIYDPKLSNFDEVKKYRVGSSLSVKGTVVLTPKMKQPVELHATEVVLEIGRASCRERV